MGDYWCKWLADVIHDEGCNVLEWSGWENRSASGGGFSAKPGGVINHHTASSVSAHGKPDWNYATFNGTNSPEYNIGIDPNGLVNILAAGGVNSSGQGGPLSLPSGTYTSNINYRLIAVSYGNRGDGSEVYSKQMMDAAVKVNAALLTYLNLPVGCATSHKEWTGTQSVCPGRKIDPYGNWEGGGSWGPQTGTAPFGLNPFRDRVQDYIGGESPIPPIPDTEEDMTWRVAKRENGAYFIGDGNTSYWVSDSGGDISTIEANIRMAPGAVNVKKFTGSSSTLKPIVTSWNDVGEVNDGNIKKYVGKNSRLS